MPWSAPDTHALVASVARAAVEGEHEWLADGVDVVGCRGSFDTVGASIAGVSWHNVYLTQARVSASTFTNCQFDRVVFDGCDLSGVTFVGCGLRRCVIRGGKAAAMLAIVDSSIASLTVENVVTDRIEVQGGRLHQLSVVGGEVGSLSFAAVSRPSRQARSAVTIAGTELRAVGGLDVLAEAGIAVEVDGVLWRQLGDLLLDDLGVVRIDD